MVTVNVNINRLIDSVDVRVVPNIEEGSLVQLLENEKQLLKDAERSFSELSENISSTLKTLLLETFREELTRLRESHQQ